MDEIITIVEGDVYQLKKSHPCGCDTFEVVRSGADCKIKCTNCSHIIMMDRVALRKCIKNVIKKSV